MTTLTPFGLYTLLAVGLTLTMLVIGSVTTVALLGTRIDTANAHNAEQNTRRIAVVKPPRKRRDHDTTTSASMIKRLRAPLALTETALVLLALVADIPTWLEPPYLAVIIALALAVAVCCAASWQHSVHHARRR